MKGKAVPEREVEKRVQVFIRMCRQLGMKVTHQRLEIFRELAASASHPDAESIYKAVRRHMPTISRDTVYRTLATIETAGLIRKVEPIVESARYDANMRQHHHFICTKCGRISDFYSTELNDLPIPESVHELGIIASAHVEVRGTCSVCAAQNKQAHWDVPEKSPQQ